MFPLSTVQQGCCYSLRGKAFGMGGMHQHSMRRIVGEYNNDDCVKYGP
jgi:hypothetical protein